MHNSFHYAFRVKDLDSTRKFYGDILGCKEGRSTESWIDFNFFGNQISAHVSDTDSELDFCGDVDGVAVPLPHFGCILTVEQFAAIRQKMEAAGIAFIIKPQTRYRGQSAQHDTMFVLDLSGNPLEFKSFQNDCEVYSKH